jgi:hypothetical protein
MWKRPLLAVLGMQGIIMVDMVYRNWSENG